MMASHELRTPLTCLQLQLQVNQWDLKNNYQEAMFQNRFEVNLQKQQENLLRITRIIDNILDETKISKRRFYIQYEYFELSEMVSDVLERFQVISKSSGMEVHFIPTHKVSGKWDRYRLEQVLNNLLINAIRYGKTALSVLKLVKREKML
jgi:signal transduction histidine kinase